MDLRPLTDAEISNPSLEDLWRRYRAPEGIERGDVDKGREDFLGRRVGTWTVVEFLGLKTYLSRGSKPSVKPMWGVRCVRCGYERTYPSEQLRRTNSGQWGTQSHCTSCRQAEEDTRYDRDYPAPQYPVLTDMRLSGAEKRIKALELQVSALKLALKRLQKAQ
jgi:hypothetical protein